MNSSKAPSCDSFHQPSIRRLGPWPSTRTSKLRRPVTSTEAAPCFEVFTLVSTKTSGIMTLSPSRKCFSLRSPDLGRFRRPRRPIVTPYSRPQKRSPMIESISNRSRSAEESTFWPYCWGEPTARRLPGFSPGASFAVARHLRDSKRHTGWGQTAPSARAQLPRWARSYR